MTLAGVDTVGISVAVVDVDTVGARVSGVQTQDAGLSEERALRKLPGGGFMGSGVGDRVWLEASLPKRAGGGEAFEALGVDQAKEVLRELYGEAQQFAMFKKGETFELARVKRLDGVREIDGVTQQQALLDGLALVKRDSRHKVRRYLDADLNRAQTLKAGPLKAWEAYLYDKHAETAGVAPKGRLRFEARMRAELLTSEYAKGVGGVVRQVGDLDQARLDRLTRGVFGRVRFDQEVCAMATVMDKVTGYEGMSGSEQLACLGYALSVAYGRDLHQQVAPNTARKYRRVLEELAITPEAVRAETGGRVTVRLDYDLGRQVISTAA